MSGVQESEKLQYVQNANHLIGTKTEPKNMLKLYTGEEVLIDEEDYDFLSRFSWHAVRDENRIYAEMRISMHRLLMGKKGMQVDHKNHNGLDNRKSNLRVCTQNQNQANRRKNKNSTSKYKGASWSNAHKKWFSKIQKDGKAHWLGYFKTESEAANAYNKKSKELNGEYSFTSTIDNGEVF